MMRRIVLAAALVFALVPLACGGDDDGGDDNGQGSGTVCEQACKKIESCNPGTVCQINGSCTDDKDKNFAQCVVEKPCDQMQSCFLGS